MHYISFLNAMFRFHSIQNSTASNRSLKLMYLFGLSPSECFRLANYTSTYGDIWNFVQILKSAVWDCFVRTRMSINASEFYFQMRLLFLALVNSFVAAIANLNHEAGAYYSESRSFSFLCWLKSAGWSPEHTYFASNFELCALFATNTFYSLWDFKFNSMLFESEQSIISASQLPST